VGLDGLGLDLARDRDAMVPVDHEVGAAHLVQLHRREAFQLGPVAQPAHLLAAPLVERQERTVEVL